AARRRRDRRGADGHLAAGARADPFQLPWTAYRKRQLRRDAPAQATRGLFCQPWRGRCSGASAGDVVGAGPARSQRARLYRRILAVLLAGDSGAALRLPDHPRAAGPLHAGTVRLREECAAEVRGDRVVTGGADQRADISWRRAGSISSGLGPDSRLCMWTMKAMPNSGVARLTIGIDTKAAMNRPAVNTVAALSLRIALASAGE